jgi:hypothetical protein
MAQAKSNGARFGRPAKPLSAGELALVAKLRAEGIGWRRCAVAVNEARGAHRLTDPKAAKRRRVSYSNVRQQAEVAGVSKVKAFQKS